MREERRIDTKRNQDRRVNSQKGTDSWVVRWDREPRRREIRGERGIKMREKY